ncbi:MAG TPA: LCP family protein, partial [Candidatus Kapabacteria bacterium]|nr:LCP family protein [Candidatus Kapabacteria bacterium]
NFLAEEEGDIRHPEPPKKKRWLLFIFLLAILGLGFVFFGNADDAPNDPLAYNPVTLEPKTPESFLKRLKQAVFTKEVMLEGQKEDRINILLLGMGGVGHDGPYLTDTIMIASIQPSTKKIALISLPRDLAVPIPSHGRDKINVVNSLGETKRADWGAAFATEVIENTFDMDIHYYARIDFTAFEEIIDEVGGITVNVDRSFTDHMYPAPKHEYQTISFEKGIQTMDGKTALMYARSRHGSNGEGSDFARAKRQQKMLLALKEKVTSFSTLLNPVRIHGIMESVDKHLTTNMEFSDIIAFMKLGKTLDTNNIVHLVFDDSPNGYLKNGYTQQGAFILEPKTGYYGEIQMAMKTIFSDTAVATKNDTPTQEEPTPTSSSTVQKVASPIIEIQNGTWSAGLAARMKKRLEDKSFTIGQIGNTTERPQKQSGIYPVTSRSSQDVALALSRELHLPVKDTVPSGISATGSSDILIVIGEDFQE